MKIALLLVFLGLCCHAKDGVANTLAHEVLDLFPLQTGNQWSYWHQRKVAVGQSGHFITVTWEQRIAIAAIHHLPQGQLVERRSQVWNVQWEAPSDVPSAVVEAIGDQVVERDPPHLLIGNHGLVPVPVWAFDSETRAFHPLFKVSAENSASLAQLFLEPKAGNAFEPFREIRELDFSSNPNRDFGTLTWDFKGVVDLDGPMGSWSAVWALEGSQDSSSPFVWFKPGIGVIGSSFQTKTGSYQNYRMLASFSLAGTP